MSIKNLFLIGLVAFVTIGCSTKSDDPKKWYEVSGNVKSIRTTGYEAIEKFGEISEGDVLYDYDNNMIMFNKDGYITDISYYNHGGNLKRKSVYVYDGDNKVLKINHYNGDGDNIGRTVYTYNEDGNPIKVVEYDKSSKIINTLKSEYDGDKCIKSQFFNEYSEGDYTIYEYNGTSMVKSVEYDKNGKKIGVYDEFENDKMTKHVTPQFTTNLTYNEKGLCSSIINGLLNKNNSYIFWKGKSYVYEYEYDDKGNWVRKVEKQMNSKKAEHIFVREIEYY